MTAAAAQPSCNDNREPEIQKSALKDSLVPLQVYTVRCRIAEVDCIQAQAAHLPARCAQPVAAISRLARPASACIRPCQPCKLSNSAGLLCGHDLQQLHGLPVQWFSMQASCLSPCVVHLLGRTSEACSGSRHNMKTLPAHNIICDKAWSKVTGKATSHKTSAVNAVLQNTTCLS